MLDGPNAKSEKFFGLVAQGEQVIGGGIRSGRKKNQPVRTGKKRGGIFSKSPAPGAVGLLLAGHASKRLGRRRLRSRCPETTKVCFGIIALTDCSSIVMAHELGLVQEVRHRVDDFQRSLLGGHPRPADAGRKPGDAHAFRDALRVNHGAARLAEEADGYSLGPNRNGQAITLDKELLAKGVRTPQALKPLVDEAKKRRHADDIRHAFPPARTPCGRATGSASAPFIRTKT